MFAIFGHGNVTCLGHALEQHQDELPTWRGQNEQGMALAATACAKTVRRRQIMVATSSVGPGATNMVTAAGVAHSNRIPLLLIAGDTFASRLPDPVLQQVEHFGEPSTTVNDAFRSVSRYWDRIMKPEQVVSSLPHAVQTMLDAADCGPAFIGLPQDVAGEAYDFPVRFFDEQIHHLTRLRADIHQLDSAAAAIAAAEKPMIIAGGGVHYSFAEAELAAFAETHNIPVVETVAGKASLLASTRCTPVRSVSPAARRPTIWPPRPMSSWRSAPGSRTSRPARGPSSRMPTSRSSASTRPAGTPPNTWPFRSSATRAALTDLTGRIGDYRAPESWSDTASAEVSQYHAYIDKIAAPDANGDELPSYAQVVGVVDRLAGPDDFALAAAGGFPGEVNNGWRQKALNSFDCEYGFSCMGYEISGGWGRRWRADKDVTVFVGDGSYLMMNSDLYSSVLSGHKMIVIVCDNGGLPSSIGCRSTRVVPPSTTCSPTPDRRGGRVDFAAHAAAMGCNAETVSTIDELEAAWKRAKEADRTTVIALQTHQNSWTEGGSWWEVGVPEVSAYESVREARAELDEGKADQRAGW